MDIKKIDFFKNTKSKHNVLKEFTEGLQDSFRKKEIHSTTYDILKETESELLVNFVQSTPDVTAGFNVLIPDSSFFEPLGICHLAIIVDCVTYYPELTHCPHTIAAFVEEDSCSLFKMWGHPHVLFLPHAIPKSYFKKYTEQEIRLSKRDLDVVFCGSFIDSNVIYENWNILFSEHAQSILKNIAENVLASPEISHMQLFLQTLEKDAAFQDELQKKQIPLVDIMNSLEVFIRGEDRLRLLNAVKGHDLYIYGSKEDIPSWQKTLVGHKNIHYCDPVPFSELPDLFMRTKVVVNSLPTIKKGYHERIFTAIAFGASVLGSENVMISPWNVYSRAILPILSPNYNKASELIDYALHDEKMRLDDVLALRKIIENEHTWDNRRDFLLQELPKIISDLKKDQKSPSTHLLG